MNDTGHPGRKYVSPDKACGTAGALVRRGHPHGLLAPTGRAPGLHPGGSRFESEAVHWRDEGDMVPRLAWAQEKRRSNRCIPTHGFLAHRVERRREVPQVRGSSSRGPLSCRTRLTSIVVMRQPSTLVSGVQFPGGAPERVEADRLSETLVRIQAIPSRDWDGCPGRRTHIRPGLASLAQSAEHLTLNQGVGGSWPSRRTVRARGNWPT